MEHRIDPAAPSGVAEGLLSVRHGVEVDESAPIDGPRAPVPEHLTWRAPLPVADGPSALLGPELTRAPTPAGQQRSITVLDVPTRPDVDTTAAPAPAAAIDPTTRPVTAPADAGHADTGSADTGSADTRSTDTRSTDAAAPPSPDTPPVARARRVGLGDPLPTKPSTATSRTPSERGRPEPAPLARSTGDPRSAPTPLGDPKSPDGATGPAAGPTVDPPVGAAPSTPTVPVSESVREAVRAVTGTDVSTAPVLRSAEVSHRAQAIDARAFTEGATAHIPSSIGALDEGAGSGLLAHELTHVVQQRAMGDRTPEEDSPLGRRFEAEAQTAERLALDARRAPTGGPAPMRAAAVDPHARPTLDLPVLAAIAPAPDRGSRPVAALAAPVDASPARSHRPARSATRVGTTRTVGSGIGPADDARWPTRHLVPVPVPDDETRHPAPVLRSADLRSPDPAPSALRSPTAPIPAPWSPLGESTPTGAMTTPTAVPGPSRPARAPFPLPGVAPGPTSGLGLDRVPRETPDRIPGGAAGPSTDLAETATDALPAGPVRSGTTGFEQALTSAGSTSTDDELVDRVMPRIVDRLEDALRDQRERAGRLTDL